MQTWGAQLHQSKSACVGIIQRLRDSNPGTSVCPGTNQFPNLVSAVAVSHHEQTDSEPDNLEAHRFPDRFPDSGICCGANQCELPRWYQGNYLAGWLHGSKLFLG